MTPEERQAYYRLSDNLRVQRVVRRVSQVELADAAGIHRTQISMLENGRRQPLALTLVRLSGALQISPDDLLSGITWKPEVGSGSFVIPELEDWGERLASSERGKL